MVDKDAPPDGFEDNGPPDGHIDSNDGPPDGFEAQSFPAAAIARDSVSSAGRTISSLAGTDLAGKTYDIGHGISSGLDTAIESPVGQAVAKVVSRSEFQPYSSDDILNPDLSGSPIEQVGKSIKSLYEIPSRTMATLQIPQVVAQNYIQEKMLKNGANKYVALAGGMIAGNIADPINVIAAVEIGGAINASLKARQALKMEMLTEEAKRAATVGEAVHTGMPPVPDAPATPTPSHPMDVIKPDEAALNAQGKPYALFIGNQEGVGPMYNVYGEHPTLSNGRYNHSTVSADTLGKEGIPILGREGRVPEGVMPGAKTIPAVNAKPGAEQTWEKSLQNVYSEKGSPGISEDIVGRNENYSVPYKSQTDINYVYRDEAGDPKGVLTIFREQPGQDKGGFYTIAVHPEFRNKGIATNLINFAKEKGVDFGELAKESAFTPEGASLFNKEIAYKPVKPLENPVSVQTEHLKEPMTAAYQAKQPPEQFVNWTNSAIKELDDLGSSSQLAAPSSDAAQDLKSTFRRYVGHQELARYDASQMTDQFAGYVPDRDRRVLLTLYAQNGKAPTIEELHTLQTTLKGVKSEGAQSLSKTAGNLIGQNLSLTESEQAALGAYNRYFEGIGENAKKVGVLSRLREIYGGPHVYESKADAEAGFMKKIISGKTRFAQPRLFDNVMEAIENGFVPKTLDSAELLSIYHQSVSKAASERYLMDTLERQGLINYQGRGQQIKGFQAGGTIVEGQIYKKIPYSENAEVQRVMARAAEDPVLDYPIVRAVEKLNTLQKTGSLYMQVFHPKALAMEAMGKGFSPMKFREGLKLVRENPDYIRSMIRSGLVVNDVADIGKELTKNAIRDYKGGNPVQLVRKANDIYQGWVFGDYMTGLKVWNSNVLTKRFVDMGIPEARAIELAVEDSNRTFGALNLKLMNRSPNIQRLFHMMAFAPDWTESRARQMMNVVGLGFGDVASRERQLLTLESWKYWSRTTAIATATHYAAMINPFEKVLAIDMSAESGFKDVTKVAKLLKLDPVYFRSKFAAVPRTFMDFVDPRMSTERKIQNLFMQPLPITAQNAIREMQKED